MKKNRKDTTVYLKILPSSIICFQNSLNTCKLLNKTYESVKMQINYGMRNFYSHRHLGSKMFQIWICKSRKYSFIIVWYLININDIFFMTPCQHAKYILVQVSCDMFLTICLLLSLAVLHISQKKRLIYLYMDYLHIDLDLAYHSYSINVELEYWLSGDNPRRQVMIGKDQNQGLWACQSKTFYLHAFIQKKMEKVPIIGRERGRMINYPRTV